MRKTHYIENEENKDTFTDPNLECELCGAPLNEWSLCEKCDYSDDVEEFDDDELAELDFDE